MLQLLSPLPVTLQSPVWRVSQAEGVRWRRVYRRDSKDDNSCLAAAGIQHRPVPFLAPIFKGSATFWNRVNDGLVPGPRLSPLTFSSCCTEENQNAAPPSNEQVTSYFLGFIFSYMLIKQRQYSLASMWCHGHYSTKTGGNISAFQRGQKVSATTKHGFIAVKCTCPLKRRKKNKKHLISLMNV